MPSGALMIASFGTPTARACGCFNGRLICSQSCGFLTNLSLLAGPKAPTFCDHPIKLTSQNLMYLLILIGHSLAMYRGKQMQRECFKVLVIIPHTVALLGEPFIVN